MWTLENRPLYNRDQLRYPSDLTDAEWQHIEPLIPPAKRGGGKRRVNMREVVNGVMDVLSTGCQWRYIPRQIPAKRFRVKWNRRAAEQSYAVAQNNRSVRSSAPSQTNGRTLSGLTRCDEAVYLADVKKPKTIALDQVI